LRITIAPNVIALDAPVEPLQLVEELAQAFGLTSGSSGTLAQGRLRVAPQTKIGMTAEFPDSNSPYGALGIYRNVSRDVVEAMEDRWKMSLSRANRLGGPPKRIRRIARGASR
jgi:hypothetical protein